MVIGWRGAETRAAGVDYGRQAQTRIPYSLCVSICRAVPSVRLSEADGRMGADTWQKLPAVALHPASSRAMTMSALVFISIPPFEAFVHVLGAEIINPVFNIAAGLDVAQGVTVTAGLIDFRLPPPAPEVAQDRQKGDHGSNGRLPSPKELDGTDKAQGKHCPHRPPE